MTDRERSEYNKKYYKINSQKIRSRRKDNYYSSKIQCPICKNNYMKPAASMCKSCSCKPENTSGFIDGRWSNNRPLEYMKRYVTENTERISRLKKRNYLLKKILCPLCNNNYMSPASAMCNDCHLFGKNLYNWKGTDICSILAGLGLKLLSNYENNWTEIRLRCMKCNTEFSSRYKSIQAGCSLCPKCYPKNQSKGETEVFDFVKKCLLRCRVKST